MPVARWVMRTAEIGGVDVLPARSGRTIGVDADIRFGNVDLDRIVDHGIDPDAGEGGVTARIAVIGRNTHETVNAGFRLQPTIGVVALDQQRGGLDAGLFAVMHFQHLDLEAAPLGPTRVHAQEHRGPVLAFGAAGAGMDFEIAVVGVGLARKQRLDLAGLCFAAHRADRRFRLGDHALIALFLAKLDQADIVFQRLGEAFDRGDAFLEALALTHQLLRLQRLVPEARNPRHAHSGIQAALSLDPSQRCLLSRVIACLISSTIFCVSARMAGRSVLC